MNIFLSTRVTRVNVYFTKWWNICRIIGFLFFLNTKHSQAILVDIYPLANQQSEHHPFNYSGFTYLQTPTHARVYFNLLEGNIYYMLLRLLKHNINLTIVIVIITYNIESSMFIFFSWIRLEKDIQYSKLVRGLTEIIIIIVVVTNIIIIIIIIIITIITIFFIFIFLRF